MLLQSTRFGQLECAVADLVWFPEGLIEFRHLHAWAVLEECPLVWLQAVQDPAVALAMVNPFCYLPDYRLILGPEDRCMLNLESPSQALVLAAVMHEGACWSLDLETPVVIHEALRVGRQIVTNLQQPARHTLPSSVRMIRKIA
jgi:flagellar assembly factor FliW